MRCLGTTVDDSTKIDTCKSTQTMFACYQTFQVFTVAFLSLMMYPTHHGYPAAMHGYGSLTWCECILHQLNPLHVATTKWGSCLKAEEETLTRRSETAEGKICYKLTTVWILRRKKGFSYLAAAIINLPYPRNNSIQRFYFSFQLVNVLSL